ncbi:ACT domain-containing protein [Ahrensia kielensis]|uniref:ACT domain-containing protein n=1 Tax=Ahrensia kielensis TaxID=76980 RepID=A0ABU9T4T8_9HYPH
MTGETNLKTLIASMQPVLREGEFVFATTNEPIDYMETAPLMLFTEEEGTTLILKREDAEAQKIKFDFPCRMITLNIHSSLDAVGFLAKITPRLAALNMGVNPVSAFYHDHLFVPSNRAQDAMVELEKMALEASTQ